MKMTQQDIVWVDTVYTKLAGKMKAQCVRVGTNIPFIPHAGKYIDCMMPDGISWWTNGFWPGMLWQMYHATGEQAYREAAEGIGLRLQEALYTFEKLHHDVGFMFMPSAVASWRETHNDDARRWGLHAANILAGRFNPTGEFIRAWNESHWVNDVSGWMIIDSLMNLPLLYWASEETSDPRYADIANRHARRALDTIMRGDGSCHHIASFNATMGEFIAGVGGQGYDEDSAWSRGQAWAVYGYALAYRHTEQAEYLNMAKQCAHYCIANLAINDWLPLLDFRAPIEPVKYDSGAAVIIACGLIEIAEHVPELERQLYTVSAIKTLAACEKKFADWDTEKDGILSGGSTMYHDDRLSDVSIIYGDYFFLEAILRLKNKNMVIW